MSSLVRSPAMKSIRASTAPYCGPVVHLRRPVRAEPRPSGQGNPSVDILSLRKELLGAGMTEETADAVVRNFVRYDPAIVTKDYLDSKLELLEARLKTCLELQEARLKPCLELQEARLKMWLVIAVALGSLAAAGSDSGLGKFILALVK